MDSRHFIDLCQALEHGEERTVANFVQHEQGQALYCDRCRIEVEVNGRRKSWPMEFCQE